MKIHCSYDKIVPIKELKSHPKNRNKHSPAQIKRLAELMLYQGIRKPVIVSNRSGKMTAGHGRIAAAKLNKWDSYPVNFQDYDNDAQEIADLNADNAIASWAELDLSGISMDIVELGPDFDVNMLGIDGFTVDVSEKQIDQHERAEQRNKTNL